jgi:hypothetical protein
MLNRFLAMGPLMEEAAAGGGGGGAAITPELKNALTEMIKPMLLDAVNSAVKGKKNEEQHGVKAIEAKLTEMISSLKPKKAAKLLARLGMTPEAKAKTPEEILAEAQAVAAGGAPGAKKIPTEQELKGKTPDMYSKRVISEFEARILGLEAENARVKIEAKESRKASAVDRALTDFPWASTDNRDMFRDYCLSKVAWNEEGTDLLMDGKDFAKHIAAEIPVKYENLLAPISKGGSGLTKGQGKPGVVDVDALTNVNSTPAEKAEASKHLAALMGAGR